MRKTVTITMPGRDPCPVHVDAAKVADLIRRAKLNGATGVVVTDFAPSGALAQMLARAGVPLAAVRA